MPFRIVKSKSILLYFLILVAFSCKKEEPAPDLNKDKLVVTKSNRNINTDYNIMGFDTYDENHIFAVGYKGGQVKLFLSSNGGSSWNDITSSFNSAWNQEIRMVQSVLYLDLNCLAFIAENRLYRSYNGGNSWSITNNGFQELPIFCAGKTEDSSLIFVENFSSMPNRVLKSSYDSPVFSVVTTLPNFHREFEVGRLDEDHFIFLDYEDDYYYDRIHQFNTITNEVKLIPIIATGYDYPVEAIKAGERIFLVGRYGNLDFASLNQNLLTPPFTHPYNLNYCSGENMGNYFIAVGEQVITTNKTGDWKNVFNSDYTKQKDILRKIKKINQDYFYVSGDKGLFFKGQIK